MVDPALSSVVARFDVFEVDIRAGELRKAGQRVRLQEQPFRVLSVLLERPGEVVTREELRQELWPADTFVDFDHGLNSAVARLREALRDSADKPRFIETIAKRGYRFIAPLDDTPPSATVPSAELAVPVKTPVGSDKWGKMRMGAAALVALVCATGVWGFTGTMPRGRLH